ncbi:MAG: hypothetical protein ACTSQF_05000 [Candidatus Heimdallarchaeaceae archaeon]
MALTSITALILLTVTILFIGFAIFSFVRAFLITRNPGYLHMGIGIVLGFFASIFASIANLFPNEEIYKGTVLILIMITNICFSLSLFSIFNGLIFIREDKLPIFSYIAALLIGASTALLTKINTGNLDYDDIYSVWKVDYLKEPLPISFGMLLIISQIVFLTYLILYLIRKSQKIKSIKNLDIGFIAIFILALWMITPFLSELSAIRFFLFPISLGLLGLALFLDPLNLLVTRILPSEITLVTKHRQPVIRYNVQNNEIDRNIEEIRLLIAGKKVVSDSVKADEVPSDLIMENREVKIINLQNFYIISEGTKINSNVVSAIKTAFRDFESQTDLEYVASSSILNEPDEILFTEIFAKHLRRIDGRKKKNISSDS